MRFATIIFLFLFLAGCNQYEISYVEQRLIAEQDIKLPDIGPSAHNNHIVEDNIAYHFTLDNYKFDDLEFNEFLRLKFFICGQSSFETDLRSALYFPEELVFVDGKNSAETDTSFYAVFIPRLHLNMKNDAKAQDKPICAKVEYHYPYELKKTSNTVKLGKLK